jgi:alkylation response protein AidB-like acyl-CoA dehydrogenase
MDFLLNEEQEMLRKAARDFLERECPESLIREIEAGDKGYPPDLWRKIAELGWLGIPFPEEYGGTGGNILQLGVLFEEMGKAMFPSPYLSTVVLCGSTILAAGNEEQKAEFLPKIVKGDLILALALTEPGASWDGKAWDAEGVTVGATADGDDYIIDGTKLFVHDAHIADYLLCVTRTKDGVVPEQGITLFLVDAKSPGISYTLLKTTAGDNQSEVIFNKLRVPKKNIVGGLNRGWAPLGKVLQQGAVTVCAEMVGAGQRILELTVDYAKTRIQFDLPIGINQYIQDNCCQILADVDGSRWVTYQAAWKLSEHLPCDMEVAIAKAWTSDAHERVCWNAHQVFAGVGYTIEDGVLPLYSRRAKSLQLYLGDSTYHRNKVAQQLDGWTHQLPKGKPLGICETPEEEQIAAWEPWRNWRKIRKT